MELGYKVNGLGNFYEVLHAWANQEYLKKCGIDLQIVQLPGEKETAKRNFFELIVEKFKNAPKDDIIREKYESFVKEYIEKPDGSVKGKVLPQMEYVFGKLLVPKELYAIMEAELEENFISSVILLNAVDYLGFIKDISYEKPYLFSYVEQEEVHKAEYIGKFAESKKMTHVYCGSKPKYYPEAKHEGQAGPLDIISLIFHADIVLTDSLPVLELAVVFHKKFLYLSGGRGEGKAAFLLEGLKLSDHFVRDPLSEEKVSYEMPDRGEFYSLLGKFRDENTKQMMQLFPEQNLDKLDACECPTAITRKRCYGCLACKEVCPTDAIVMHEDKEGFLYPLTDYEKCIRCGLCNKICIRNKVSYLKYEEEFPKIICARNKDKELLNKSTSGAVFPELVKYAIEEKKGVVVGVRYGENMSVVSDIAETMEDAEKFYGSKYVKSSFSGIFPNVKKILDEGRFVLYSGLPCECAGLKSYLKKDYDNLLICEIVCHSVPSPKVFRMYLDYLEKKKKSKVKHLTFRQKSDAYTKMVFSFENEQTIGVKYWKNNYFRAFSKDYIVRPSCSCCSFTYKKRVGDVTIGDFWGAARALPEMEDNKALSIILMNTPKGEAVVTKFLDSFEKINELTFWQAFIKNHRKSNPMKPERAELFAQLGKIPVNTLLERYNDLAVKPAEKTESTVDAAETDTSAEAEEGGEIGDTFEIVNAGELEDAEENNDMEENEEKGRKK